MTRRRPWHWTCAALLLLMVAGSAQSRTATSAAPGLAQSIDAFISQPQFIHADWGIAVLSLDTGRMLYAHNADRLFIPASNVKLFTTALVLEMLGSNRRIATTLYATTGHVSLHGVLRGDLILYGRGDPSLGLQGISPQWADRMAAALAKRGIKQVRGDLIADATYFIGRPVGRGWAASDLQTWYGATPSALNVMGNVIEVKVARHGHDCCDLTVTPAAAGVRVENLTSSASGDDPPFGLYRPLGSSILYAIGQHPRRHRYMMSMPDPARTAGNLLRAALHKYGITLTGKLRVLHWPQPDPALAQPGAVAIANIQSPPVGQLVDHMLKHSDNLYAQSLLLQAGVAASLHGDCERRTAPDTSIGWALCALRGLLHQANISPAAVRLVEGSGLTRHDLATPDALVQLLSWVMTQPWAADLRNALPVAGVDGTLEYRFRQGPASDNMQAKTGTLNHDYTLTGFVTDAAGEHLVFSILLNRYPRWSVAHEYPHAPSPDKAIDTIAKMLANHGGSRAKAD